MRVAIASCNGGDTYSYKYQSYDTVCYVDVDDISTVNEGGEAVLQERKQWWDEDHTDDVVVRE